MSSSRLASQTIQPQASMPKRIMWDLEVQVNVVDLGDPNAQPYMLSYGILELAPLQFFRNLPLPEEGNMLQVDLVSNGMSPWPVDGHALRALVECCKPLATSQSSAASANSSSGSSSSSGSDDGDTMCGWALGRSSHAFAKILRKASTSLYPLLLCADAMCLTKDARRGLDGLIMRWVADEPLVYIINGTEDVIQKRYMDWIDGWAEVQGTYMLRLVYGEQDGAEHEATRVKACDLLPVLRWAALALLEMLDVLCLRASVKLMLRKLLHAGKLLMWGDKHWLKLLQGLATSTRLSASTRSLLFTEAMLTSKFEPQASIAGTPLPADLTMKQAVLHGISLSAGVQLSYTPDAFTLLPLAVKFDDGVLFSDND